MRPFRFLPKPIRVILIINLIVFVIGALNENIQGLINAFGALINPFDVYVNRQTGVVHHVEVNSLIYQAWRYVTYAFIHGGFWHLFVNMFTLWIFGADVCDMLGSKKFVGLYLFSAVFAALFSLPFYYLGIIGGWIVGASGALMGIYWACYKLFPENTLYIWGLFPVKMKYFIWFIVFLDIVSARSSDGIAHYTHLGGILAGVIFMFLFNRGYRQQSSGFGNLGKAFAKFRGPKFKVHRGGRSESESGEKSSEDSDAIEGEVFYVDEQKRMDEILKKVNSEGINSLTESERQFLLRAGEKLRRRRGGF